MEIWKPINNYENIYQISNFGRIKSLARKSINGKNLKEKILVPSIDKYGYKKIALTKNNKKKFYKVHRLIAEQFIINEENKPCVNHIDGNKSNNCINNLEWVTYQENIKHAFLTGLNKGRNSRKGCL